MIWRGKQYTRGIKLYYRKTRKFPTSLDDLTKPQIGNIRFMRQAYKDPMNSKDGEWRLIYVGPNGQLIGSLKPQQTIQLSGISGMGGTPPGTPAAQLGLQSGGLGLGQAANQSFGNTGGAAGLREWQSQLDWATKFRARRGDKLWQRGWRISGSDRSGLGSCQRGGQRGLAKFRRTCGYGRKYYRSREQDQPEFGGRLRKSQELQTVRIYLGPLESMRSSLVGRLASRLERRSGQPGQTSPFGNPTQSWLEQQCAGFELESAA